MQHLLRRNSWIDDDKKMEVLTEPQPGVVDVPEEVSFYQIQVWWYSWSVYWTRRVDSAQRGPLACHMMLTRWLSAVKRVGVKNNRHLWVFFPLKVRANLRKKYKNECVFAHLYRAVEMSRKAILNEQSCEVEHCQKQGFELSIVWTVTH